MTFKGMLNTLHTATGGTKRDWEEEKRRKAEQEKRDSEYHLAQARELYDSGDQPNVRDPNETGPALGAEHNPEDAYKATQKNVKEAIANVSKVPGASIAQQEIHKQAAREFAQKNGINPDRFLQLHPDVQKDVMASSNPMAELKRYNNAPNYWDSIIK